MECNPFLLKTIWREPEAERVATVFHNINDNNSVSAVDALPSLCYIQSCQPQHLKDRIATLS